MQRVKRRPKRKRIQYFDESDESDSYVTEIRKRPREQKKKIYIYIYIYIMMTILMEYHTNLIPQPKKRNKKKMTFVNVKKNKK